jgi:hypothetical protein
VGTISMRLSDWSAGHYGVRSSHFGANAILVPNTEEGRPKDNYLAAHRALDATTLRFPAGQPEILYKDGMLKNGRLIPEVAAFLDWAVLHDQKVTIVTPTKAHWPGKAVVTDFVRQVLERYGAHVEAFEIGNEFWSDTDEHHYGKHASLSAEAIHDGIYGSGHAPDILVQTANPTGAASLFKGTDTPWMEKLELSNQYVIDALSEKARDAIDGIVDHFYFNEDPGAFQGSAAERQYMDTKIDQWRAALGKDVEVHVTEWNVRADNYPQLGMKAASVMLEQFEQMIRMGVDAAQVWATQHNTSTDLGGHWGEDIRVGDDGIVRSSINGAMFDLMSSSLPGLRLRETSFSGDNGLIEIDAYGSSRKVVVYLASRSTRVEDVEVDLGTLVAGYGLQGGIRIGIDQSTSDGRHWQQSGPNGKGWYDLDGVMIDGAIYYATEHDVAAQIEHLSAEALGGGSEVSVRLNPFEVVELTFEVEGAPRPALRPGEEYVGVVGEELVRIAQPATVDEFWF